MCEPVKTSPADVALGLIGAAVALTARGLWIVASKVLAPVAVLLAALGIHGVRAARRRWHEQHTPVVTEVVILQPAPRLPAIPAARRAIDSQPNGQLLWSQINKEHTR